MSALLLLAAPWLPAQTAPAPAPDAATLARYDANGNGAIDPSEQAAIDADRRNAASAATTAAEADEDIVSLSPFEVVSDTRGYFAANTMSGTRLNAKLEDLGQSLSVMTKDQMQDFAMLDVNDVFDYMASAEGTGTYSDFVTDRNGNLTDNVMLSPTTANRVRGIGSVNIALNNIEMSRRVPIDPLWVDSVELSRGPNANIFGLGNPAGTVNQVGASANLGRDFAQLAGRVDSYDGWRATFDVNRVLKEGVLAVRANVAYQHTGFVRKPSGEDIRRLSAHIKARPFKSTTLTLSVFDYDNDGTRVNFTTPRDYISYWLESGMPAWNPVARTVTINGVTTGPFTTIPEYFQYAGGATQRSNFFIGRNGETYWTAPRVSPGDDPNAAPSSSVLARSPRLLFSAPTPPSGGLETNGLGQFTNQPLFAATPAVSDRSIYDWGSINTGAPNWHDEDVTIYFAQLDQIFIDNRRHQLAGQVAFMREDAELNRSQPLGNNGNSGQSGQLYVDVNSHNIDGSVNPFFGRPYFASGEPLTFDQPLQWDTTRAQLAYRFNFEENTGWSRHLGTHQLLGYYEYKDRQSRQYVWREALVSDHSWTAGYADNMPRANRTTSPGYIASPNIIRIWERFYVGDTPGGGVEYAASRMPVGTFPFIWGNTGNFRTEQAEIALAPSSEGSAAGNAERLVVKTTGGVIQSFLFDNRLVTTFGLREDKVYDRSGADAVLTPDLRDFDYAASNQWAAGDWGFASGKTKTASIVARPFRDIRSLREGGFFGRALASMSLTYNKSDNFIPEGPAVDLSLSPLPNQTGEGEDYGFWLNLFDDKLVLRVNWYDNKQINVRNGEINVIAQRVLRADGLASNDAWNLIDRATDWVAETQGLDLVADADAIRAEVAEQIGIPIATQDALMAANSAGRLAATQDIVSKGTEIEINYNPARHWTVSANFTETKAINQNAGSSIEDWINQRMPIWETIVDPRHNERWRYISGETGYHNTQTAATNFATFVEGPLAVFRETEGRPRPQIRRYAATVSSRFSFDGVSEHRILKNVTVGGALRWQDKGAIGYFGVQSLPDRITRLDVNRPVYEKDHTFLDLFVSYRTRLFSDKIRANFQLNVKNLQEDGDRLRPTAVYPNGEPVAYRIVDPRQFIFSATFDF